MCQRYSWIETYKGVFFLTGEDVYNTEQGKVLRRYCQSRDDYIGHGAIISYYGVCYNDLICGINKECTDFSSPDDFPPELVKAIKLGKMRKLGCDVDVVKMITKKALAKIPAFYKALAAYHEVCNAFDEASPTSFTEADRTHDEANDVYDAFDKAWTVYNKACIKYNDKFWDLFTVKSNRIKAWR